MSSYAVKDYYKIKHEEKEYPWPCNSEPDRTIILFDDDVLTKAEDGTFTKHTGACCMWIQIPEEDLIYCTDEIKLRMF